MNIFILLKPQDKNRQGLARSDCSFETTSDVPCPSSETPLANEAVRDKICAFVATSRESDGKSVILTATVGMMLAAVWLAGLLAGVVALSASSGGPGDALYIGYTQGAYISDFPLPEETVTAEFWTKLFPVGWGIVVF